MNSMRFDVKVNIRLDPLGFELVITLDLGRVLCWRPSSAAPATERKFSWVCKPHQRWSDGPWEKTGLHIRRPLEDRASQALLANINVLSAEEVCLFSLMPVRSWAPGAEIRPEMGTNANRSGCQTEAPAHPNLKQEQNYCCRSLRDLCNHDRA